MLHAGADKRYSAVTGVEDEGKGQVPVRVLVSLEELHGEDAVPILWHQGVEVPHSSG